MILDETVYSNEDFLQIISNMEYEIQKNKTMEYINLPCAFDIETSSFYNGENKQVIMYIWQLCINGYVTIGRTWESFVNIISKLERIFNTLPESKHLVIYVHNLSYEFQFMRKHFNWFKIFAISSRRPIYALTDGGVEFRCSYLLSGYSLAKLSDEITKYKVSKKEGDLDYSLIRSPKTELTKTEIGYCISDVHVVVAYIQEKIENEGGIIKIPLTKTGYVRNYCRNKCLYTNNKYHSRNKNYDAMIKNLTLEVEEYHYLKQAFQGGFTHANFDYVQKPFSQLDKIQYNVKSKDFTSSYPSVIMSEYFPMSKGKKIKIKNEEEFRYYLKNYCCVFPITMYGVHQKSSVYENPISASRCIKNKGKKLLSYGIQENNGRVHEATKLTMIITEVDFQVYEQFYDIDFYKCHSMYIYKKAYLPKELIECALKFYVDKTTLKDVEGKEVEYLLMKGMLNSIYGMMVTDICRKNIIYDDEWDSSECNFEEEIKKYNNSKKRFLFYPWGIYVTAYARRNLFSGILALGSDYIYSDTDSVKYKNAKNHEDYFNKYNKMIEKKIQNCLAYHGLYKNSYKPKTITGKEKPLGVWDDDGEYTRFKTLGAKRYMVEYIKDGELHQKITIAGLGKNEGLRWLKENYPKDPFQGFTHDMKVPAEKTGKNTHTYIDEEMIGVVKDYKGVYYKYHEFSGIHLEPAPFSLSLSDKFIEFLSGYAEVDELY